MSLRNNGKQKEGITIETKRLNGNCAEDIVIAAELLKNGGLVAIPTETVYGLAADATNGAAVERIFKAKGRPLIVHISSYEQLERLVSHIPEHAKRLMETFWPGPLTVILPKSNLIPDQVSAGLPTVAVRLPSHPVARAVIQEAGVPLAAPSANVSGSPSPTAAAHVLHDLDGKIDAVIDGGPCTIGLESTVITLAEETPVLLRPGAVTLEQLQQVLGTVKMADAVLHQLKQGSVAALCYDGQENCLCVPAITYGKKDCPQEQAQQLFHALRKLDDLNYKLVYAACPQSEGLSLAVYNRMIRAAGFEVQTLD